MAVPAKLRAPGWYRAAFFDVLGLGFAFGLTVLVRWLMHQHPVIDGSAITIVALIAVPLFFLVGLGTSDYRFYWISGTVSPRHWNHVPGWKIQKEPATLVGRIDPGTNRVFINQRGFQQITPHYANRAKAVADQMTTPAESLSRTADLLEEAATRGRQG